MSTDVLDTVEQGTVVRLLAPTEPLTWTEDKSQVRPWMLGELDDVLHRLRMGGADEQTEVRFKHEAIEACIPFAEFALTPAPPRKPAPLPNPVHVDRPRRLVTLRTVLVLVALVAAVLVGVWLG